MLGCGELLNLRGALRRRSFFPKTNKYGAKTANVEGITFHSKREAEHYKELLLLERAGEISDIQRQVLLRLEVNGKIVCRWKPDFIYRRKDGRMVIDETKGFRTRDFDIKWKLAQALLEDEYEFVLS